MSVASSSLLCLRCCLLVVLVVAVGVFLSPCVVGFVVLPVLSLFAVVFLVRRRHSVLVSEVDIG